MSTAWKIDLTKGSELYFPLKVKGILEDFSRSADHGTMY